MAQETIKSVINQTFRALREDTRIAAGTNELADDGTDAEEVKLFELVMDAIEEIAAKHTWRCFQTRVTMTYTAGQDSVAAPAGLYEDAELLRDIETGRVLAWDVTDAANPCRLDLRPVTEIVTGQEEDIGATNTPRFIALATDGDTPSVRLFPVPTTNRDLAFWAYNPPERLDPATAGVLSTVLKLPARVIRRLLIWWEAEERGEELGTKASLYQDRYEAALVEEIQNDQRAQGAYDEQLYSGRPV